MTHNLKPDELDRLQTALSAGARRAGHALSQMTGLRIGVSALRVEELSLDAVASLLGGPEEPVTAVVMRLFGEARGRVVVALDPASVRGLVSAVVPGEDHAPERLSEMGRSCLLEVGNILAASLVNALGDVARRSIVPSVPSLAFDMAGALLDSLLAETFQGETTALVAVTELISVTPPALVRAHVLLLPDPAALPSLVQTLHDAGAAEGC